MQHLMTTGVVLTCTQLLLWFIYLHYVFNGIERFKFSSQVNNTTNVGKNST